MVLVHDGRWTVVLVLLAAGYRCPPCDHIGVCHCSISVSSPVESPNPCLSCSSSLAPCLALPRGSSHERLTCWLPPKQAQACFFSSPLASCWSSLGELASCWSYIVRAQGRGTKERRRSQERRQKEAGDMGEEARIRKQSKGACSTLHNWMGEPAGDQDDEEEKTLQLSLGLPGGGGGGGWRTECREKGSRHSTAAADSSMLSLGYSTAAAFSHAQGNNKAKGSPASALASTNNGSQTRSPTTPVIGWPPVRSFRRNLATSAKASLEQPNGKKAAKPEETKRAPFVKINMDGIPIGRKIDLNALDSYDTLSLAVDKLFRGLLAAQQGPLDAGRNECPQEEVAISGLLDGTGEYTLVYEDYEGDRMLVGDVPWGMFVSSVKRLRVLKTSDLSSSLTASGRKRTVAEC